MILKSVELGNFEITCMKFIYQIILCGIRFFELILIDKAWLLLKIILANPFGTQVNTSQN
jgi:hypothetical protein